MAKEIVGLDDSGPDSFKEVIDIGEIFGVDAILDRAMLESFGQEVIDYIVKRTEDGKRYDGTKFKGYDEDYVKSEEFKAYGKSASEVNLTQTGNMLGQLDILQIEGNRITIGWEDNEERAKAFGHHTGMRGHPILEGKTPPRPFFGMTLNQLNNLAGPYIDELKQDQITDRDPKDMEDKQVTLSVIDQLKKASLTKESTRMSGLLDFFFGDEL